MEKPFHIESVFEIKKRDKTFLNIRRISLLKALNEEGSIRAAALKIRMSYQQAWHYVKEMNEISPLPLVVYKRGGSNGGGSELTTYGKKTIEEYEKIKRKISDSDSALSNELWVGDFF